MSTSLLNNLITLLVALGAVTPSLLKLSEALKARTRNAHIEAAINFAELVVETIGEANSMLTPNQRGQAIDALQHRLDQNSLGKHFTPQEVASYIDQAAQYIEGDIEDDDN